MSVQPDPLERAVARALAEKSEDVEDARTKLAPAQVADDKNTQADQSMSDGRLVELEHLAKSASPKTTYDRVEVDLDALASRRVVGHLKGGVEANVFSMLRTQVLHKLRRNKCRSLAVVGPVAGVGKSFVALNLALSIAKQGNLNVALVDFDLRKPSVANLLGVERDYSMADYLSDECTLADVGFTTQLDNFTAFAGQGSTMEAAELLANKKASRLVKDLAPDASTLVIVDLPPLCGIADVHTFLPNCDAALLVLEYAKTTKHEIEESVRLIGSTPLVGSLVNRGRVTSSNSYGYGYGAADRN